MIQGFGQPLAQFAYGGMGTGNPYAQLGQSSFSGFGGLSGLPASGAIGSDFNVAQHQPYPMPITQPQPQPQPWFHSVIPQDQPQPQPYTGPYVAAAVSPIMNQPGVIDPSLTQEKQGIAKRKQEMEDYGFVMMPEVEPTPWPPTDMPGIEPRPGIRPDPLDTIPEEPIVEQLQTPPVPTGPRWEDGFLVGNPFGQGDVANLRDPITGLAIAESDVKIGDDSSQTVAEGEISDAGGLSQLLQNVGLQNVGEGRYRPIARERSRQLSLPDQQRLTNLLYDFERDPTRTLESLNQQLYGM